MRPRTAFVLVPLWFAGCAAPAPVEAAPAFARIQLQHTAAADLAPILDEVLRPSSCCVIRSPAHEPPTGRVPTPVIPELRFTVDERTNSVVLTGPVDGVSAAFELIARLDVPDARARHGIGR